MGSTACVRCGANLMPHSYCNICHEVLYFTCSSCSMNTDERIHAYCRDLDTVNNIVISDNKWTQRPTIDVYYINTQDQLNEEIKYNSINISTSYWNNIFESIKLINRYWSKMFSIGIDSPPVAFQKDRTILYLK
jgi:hypothetical protein